MKAETISDIVREMREFADKDSQSVGRDVLRRQIQHFADRFEAAYKRESVTDCNALNTNPAENVNSDAVIYNNAKIRGALEDAEKTLSDSSRSLYGIPPHLHKLLARIRDALSAPARNCDIGTAEEQYKRCRDSLMSRGLGEFIKANTMSELAFKWSQMPYEEGGAV